MLCEDCSFFVDEMCTDDMEAYVNKETGLNVCRYNPNAILRERGECEFCEKQRPLILYGEYQICHNCMMRVIAAAPDLLRALEDTLEDYERIAGFIGLKPEDFENIRCARAAIAKAKNGIDIRP